MFGTSLRARLAVAMSVLLALMLVLAILGAATLARVETTAQATLDDLAGINALATSMTHGVHMQVRVAEAQVGEPTAERARQLLALSDSTHALRRALQRWDGFTETDHQLLTGIEGRQSRGEVAWAVAHALAATGRRAEAAGVTAAARLAADSLLGDVERLLEAQRGRAYARAAEVRAASARRRNVLWFLVGTALVTGVLSIALTLRAVTRPLARLSAATQRFGQGDLRAADLSGMPAELAALGGAMNLMSARLRHLTSSIRQESREVGLHASDLSAMSQELAATSGDISEAMLRLSEGAERQLATLREAGRHLERLGEAGASTLQAARRVVAAGGAIAAVTGEQERHVRNAAAALLALRETVRRASTEAREAGRRAANLHLLVDGERQLATNVGVLAVNSAIEAARAGAQGAGLGAVTAELRQLEAQCGTTADGAEGAVGGVRDQITAVLQTLEEGSSAVLGIEVVAERAAAALEEIGRGIAEMRVEAEQVVGTADQTRRAISAVLDQTEAVARTATEQAVTGETVSAATEEQTAATEELAAAAARLNDAAQRLEGMLAEFRA